MQPGLPEFIGLLIAAIVLATAAKRVQIPYSVALVIGGMVIAISGVFPTLPRLTPEAVFLVCLPALLFEGGITADFQHIKANAVPIAIFATVGMILAVAGTGAALHLALDLPWGAALLLGAILSVTDTVSILYAFRRIRVPSRLSGVILGESLFNDGTALVAYTTLSAVVVGGSLSPVGVSAQMVLTTVGGLVFGLALGLLASFVMRRMHDPLAEIMATTALAFSAYVFAEQVHASGAIAAVTAGLVVGTSLRRELAPQSLVALNSFWEYVAFGVNTFLFLSVGLSTHPVSLVEHLPETLVAFGCVVAGRAAAVYLPFLFLRRFRRTDWAPLRWQHVFVIGNIKGAISIALALGLPASVPARPLLVDIAFGVTFLSLVFQGLSLTRLIRMLGLVREDPLAGAISEQQARLIAARSARQELETLHAAGLVPRMGYERLRSDYQVTIAEAERELRRLQESNLTQGARVLLHVRRRLLDAERTALVGAARAGLIGDEAAERLLAGVDERTLELERLLSGEESLSSQG